ncbi:DUF721 domain-containing protein [Streptomyces sp. NRRL F-5630]|uniref:DUF721 domain-containing protein n=1 Tax=Streptomyces sp. NRRL F-5630 TaxID=1463864 RepID=UPI003D736F0C
MTPPQKSPSGADLARVALRAALEEARKNGAGRPASKAARPARPAPRRNGREPLGLGAAIEALLTERAWELPAAGATLRERWAVIAPDLAENVAAVAYDAHTGCLTLSPRTPAWATETRLRQTQIIEAANTSAGRTVVRAVRVLTPGTRAAPAPANSEEPAAPGHVRRRQDSSGGYRNKLGAPQQTVPAQPLDHDAQEADRRAGQRQAEAMKTLTHCGFPDEAPGPSMPATTNDRQVRAAAIEAARRRARADRLARTTPPTKQEETA